MIPITLSINIIHNNNNDIIISIPWAAGRAYFEAVVVSITRYVSKQQVGLYPTPTWWMQTCCWIHCFIIKINFQFVQLPMIIIIIIINYINYLK